MDVWIVAAAAGAGYVAQRLKNLGIRKHNSSDLSSEILHFIKPEPPRNLKKVQFEEEICKQRQDAYQDASTSGFEGENLIQLDNFASWGMVSDSNSLAGIFKKEDVHRDWEGRVYSDTNEVITSDSVSQPSSRENGFLYGFRRNRSRLGSSQISSKFIKPRTSLESCLMAQLYKERTEIEEYSYSIHPSQKPTVRPFLVTDGSRIISRAPHQSCSKPNRRKEYKQLKDTHSQENKTAFCVPRLPSVVAVDLQMEAKAKTGKEQEFARGNTSKLINENQSNAQGSSNGALLFFLGLTMGISYSLSGHKLEIDKLRKSLKQTENLVQDLQEELEMKDVLTVKELAVEDYDSPVHKDSYFDDAMQMLSLEQKLNSSSTYFNDGNDDQNTKEESLKKIEAELEAELDRLESSMNSSGLERKLSDVAELDPDFMPYVTEGELRADLFGVETKAYTVKEESSSITPHFSRYPVSPRELSLRLHEVIQSRLEERVKELETALEYSKMKIKCMESEHIRPWREVPGRKTGSSSTLESPDAIDQPAVINLSGEALAAYNEAYDAFTKVSESDEEESNHNHQEIFHTQIQDLENGCLNSCYMKQQYLALSGSLEVAFNRKEEEDVDADNVVLNDVIYSSRDESRDGEDEMERLLIRQIVEKARQGSPAVLKAQRAFLSTHES